MIEPPVTTADVVIVTALPFTTGFAVIEEPVETDTFVVTFTVGDVGSGSSGVPLGEGDGSSGVPLGEGDGSSGVPLGEGDGSSGVPLGEGDGSSGVPLGEGDGSSGVPLGVGSGVGVDGFDGVDGLDGVDGVSVGVVTVVFSPGFTVEALLPSRSVLTIS